MKHFALYLWKEWREQRAALLALTLLLPAVVLAVAFAIPARQVGRPLFCGAAGVMALVATLVVVGGELLSTDRRTAGTWLERLPAGRAGAYPAKLALHLASAGLALPYGIALGVAVAFLRGQGERLLADEGNEVAWLALLPFLALALAAWTFAAAAWSPRGMIALGSGALLLGGLALPLWVHERYHYVPADWEGPTAGALVVLAALASSWAGFVRGQRFGRGAGASAPHGLSTGALCLLPLWGWSAYQLEARDAIDLASCEFGRIWATPDGRRVFLEVTPHSERWESRPDRVVVVDLEQGTWRRIGDAGARLGLLFDDPAANPLAEPDVLCLSSDSTSDSLLLDPRSGEPLPGIGAEVDTWTNLFLAGHGWLVFEDGERVVIDPYRGTETTLAALDLSSRDVWVGPSGWLVRAWPVWLEGAPETGELVPAEWMEPVLDLGPMLPDGRILALLDDTTYGLVDPAAHRIEAVAAPEFVGYPENGQEYPWRSGDPFLVDANDETLRFDAECLELVPLDASWDGRFLRAFADGSMLFLTDEGLVRREEDGSRETVFAFTAPEVRP